MTDATPAGAARPFWRKTMALIYSALFLTGFLLLLALERRQREGL